MSHPFDIYHEHFWLAWTIPVTRKQLICRDCPAFMDDDDTLAFQFLYWQAPEAGRFAE